MENTLGERKERLRRNSAGVNRTLSHDFEWPVGFGTEKVSTLPTMINTSSIAQSTRTSSRPRSQSVMMENVESCDNTVIETSSKSMKSLKYRFDQINTRSVHSSKKSSTSIDLQKKRLAIQTEKEKQTLNKMKEDLEIKKKELDNRMKILRMEHELKEAELEAEGNSAYDSQTSENEYSHSENGNRRKSSVVEWVNNVESVAPPDNELISEAKGKSSDEIQMLCQTLTDVIKTVAPARQDTLLARNIMDRDFPVFDGNPENWPLFHQRFLQISQMCDYSADEILVKLQKCLRGEAKSAVAGLLLSPKNTNLILDTLKRRFGRPEYIIEVMIAKIKNIPPIRDNIDKLINFSNEVCNLVATMESFFSLDHLRNPQLQKDLLAKLPDMMKLRWGEYMMKNKGNVSLKDFASWIGEMAEAACYVTNPQVPISQPDNKFNPKRTYFQKRHDTVLNTKEIVKKASENRGSTCLYCEKKIHAEKICPQMTSDDLDTRWKIITEKKLCFSCLQKGHQKFKCKNRQECGTDGCKFYHHPLLHKARSSQLVDVDQDCLPNSGNELVCAVKHQTKQILLRMLPVLIHGPKGVLRVLALCDEASTVTLMDESIAKKLGLRGEVDPLCIQWTNGQTACHDKSEKIDMKISGLQNSTKFALKNVRTIDSLLLPEQTVDMEVWGKHEYLRGLPIVDINNERPMLLLGQDNIILTTPRQFRNGPETCPVAARCQLGWSLHGPTPNIAESGKIHTFHVCDVNKTEDDLHELIKQSFSIEAFGVCIDKAPKPSKDNVRAMNIMESTAKRVGERFEIGLLWKFEKFKFPESRPTAIQRLRCVERKLQRDRILADDYSKKITSYIEKGYAKKLTPQEAEIETPRTWYLPHFPVINPRKPGKMRLVFDAAAKCNGYSLNDFLLSGPDLLQPLVSVLWKFRQRKYGICGDVCEMFHQVLIRKTDREAQRFLWRGLDLTKTPDTYEMQVMTFGATCSPVCAQFIKNLNAKEQASSDRIFKAITEKFYVDDYLDSVDTEEEAVSMINEVSRVLDLGGFQIVNWISNSTAVRRALPETLLKAKMLDSGRGSAQRVLGIWWDPKTDQILVNLNQTLTSEQNVTKRHVMKNVMSIFDPLGLIAFYAVRAKIIMQDIWRSGIQWDEKLPSDLEKNWISWTKDLKEVAKIKIPRCYSPSVHLANDIQLHVFADASEKAFAAVAYLRIVSESQVNVSLVAAKTKVAPLKPLSIPRMELQAAVMASRLSCSIIKHVELNIQKMNFWTDSKCVLDWIKADGRKYQQFVAHRIGEIQELTNTSDWRWVSSKENIADEATRPSSSTPYANLFVKWIHGPEFLKKPEEFWPVLNEKQSDDCHDSELEKKNNFVAIVLHGEEYNYLPAIERFSQWIRLIRATSWLLRFCKILISRVKNQKIYFGKCVSVEEFQKAEQHWIKYSQWQSFREDIIALRNNAPLEGRSRLKQLNAALDENGLLILKGRTNLARCMSMQTKEPCILSPHNAYTKLLLQHFHVKFRHQGVETILNEIRQKFWVIDGRAAVKSTFTRCLKCRKSKVKPSIPMMGQLPAVRLTPDVRAFINVGMDYFGPLKVTVGRRTEKRWGVLFTCMAVRAIHLEVAHSLSTDSAIMAIRRMISRRGKPSTIYCDNGTNFRGASEELRKALLELDCSSITDTMVSEGIIFRFLPAASPHMGGIWERLIGSVKRTIGITLYDQSLKDETLRTLFAEAENIVNSRPLTHVSVDPADPEALTPNHFLIGYGNQNGPPCSAEISSYSRKEWRKSQMLTDAFWKRWVREYLPKLTRRTKWIDDNKCIAIGDIVLIVDDSAPRNSWKIGRVEKVILGPDGRIRVADVKTRTSTFRRPVAKLCRLLTDGEEN